jgi:hypothetical protein
MTDTDTINTAYDRYQQTSKQANEVTKAAIFDALADEGIEKVAISFDGEGDSGQMESPTAYRDGGQVEIPGIPVTLHVVQWGSDSVGASTVLITEAILTLCYALLSDQQGGWENNDGAYGDFTFHVGERRIELEFWARYTDSTLFSYTF